ncbi:MAG: hypothetical protein FH756_14615 [Firmicutes bacterium]|nr:hypothetical protein [Bacillota bacterium]
MEDTIHEILSNLAQVGDYLKTLVLGRLFGYYISVSDFSNKYARLCIDDVGEKSDVMLTPTIAYGILAKAAIAQKKSCTGHQADKTLFAALFGKRHL